jgi:hypothetical protein
MPFNEICFRGSYTPLAYNPKLFYKYNFAINHHIYLRDFPHESSGIWFCWNHFSLANLKGDCRMCEKGAERMFPEIVFDMGKMMNPFTMIIVIFEAGSQIPLYYIWFEESNL